MNKRPPAYSVNECKIQASKLLKALHAEDEKVALQAAKRLQRLPEFKQYKPQVINTLKIQRKHALNVIALEKGFNTWSQLKEQLPFIKGGFLNHWFASYKEAKAYQQSHGGFLLPFKNQFFICSADYINALGFDAKNRDWKLIGYDWVIPENKQAQRRLYREWMQIQGADHA